MNYISDSLVLKNKKLYNIENDKLTRVTQKNWHKYLNDYGYIKLPLNLRLSHFCNNK